MEEKKIKLAIGFIVYGKSTIKYLPFFLPSLIADISDTDITDGVKIFAFDNGEEEGTENVKYIRENYPKIEITHAGGNLGFAKAYNKMIRKSKVAGAEYFFALNPDMIIEKGAIAKMVDELDKDDKLGSVCPKLLKWDFENNPAEDGAGKKTDIIDSCGIKLISGLRFFETGQGEIDNGQYDNEEIFGPSGAAAVYRMEALEKVKEGENYFDELMFMYKEDCDLDYRMFLAGFKSKMVKDAIIYHRRTASGSGESNTKIALNRKNKSRQVKKWSFLNQHIIFIKYWNLQSFNEQLKIIWHGFKMFVFALLFEQYLSKEYFNLLKIFKSIKKYK